jgi:TonB dependent receptor
LAWQAPVLKDVNIEVDLWEILYAIIAHTMPSKNPLWENVLSAWALMSTCCQPIRYVRLDAGLDVPVANWKIQLGARNLGDIRYGESVTAVDNVFQGSRRQWWIGLRGEI